MEPTNQIPECEEARQVVVATYQYKFIVPKGIDLTNKEQVRWYESEHGVLTIYLEDGETMLKVSSFQDIEGPAVQQPDDLEIIDSIEEGLDLDDYEDNYEECEIED